MKANYETRARKFIRDIQPYLKGIRINNPNGISLRKKVTKFNLENHRKVKVCEGASRYALITSDYVIKIDKYRYSCWGTSKNEVFAYSKAKEQGMEHLLVKITPYTYHGRTYYIMPKVLVCNDNEEKVTNAYWNLNTTERTFIESYFYDLHNGNTGIYKGQYVLLDYASNSFSEEDN